MKIRVYYEDTDCGGIVYHSNYLNFCERARSEIFFADGGSPLLEDGGFIVASLEAKFKAPAKLGDLLEVKTELLSLKNSSLELLQSVYKDNNILFEMKIKLGFVKDSKIGRLSPQNKAYMMKLFKQNV